MRPGPKPCFTLALLHDILAQQALLREVLSPARRGEAPPAVRWYVMGSRIPGIFNLGGDLGHFAEKIRARDLSALRRYGHLCVEAIFGNAEAFRAPVGTIALVQGDALGGGFECALAFDVIVAERSAKFGLPEILFNLFPGMGAYSFLARRIGTVQAERLITSGRLYTAEELHGAGRCRCAGRGRRRRSDGARVHRPQRAQAQRPAGDLAHPPHREPGDAAGAEGGGGNLGRDGAPESRRPICARCCG